MSLPGVVEVNLNEKKANVTEKLQKRDNERLGDIQKRKNEKEQSAASNEKTDFFSANFYRAKIGIEEDLADSNSVVKSKLADHFDSMLLAVQKMQTFLSDSIIFLPAHDVQRANEAISKLNSGIQETKEQLLPKKKFAFKSKKKAAPENSKTVEDIPDGGYQRLQIELTELRFTDISDQTLSKSDKEIFQSDVALAQLINCTIKLFGSPSTLHMNNLKGCTILCGPVSSSIFVDDCQDCTFVVPCQQLRVHSTTNSKFYLHVTSRAIIEDCNTLLFAPYNLEYPGNNEHYAISGLDKARNAWDDVDDFNWLASDAHSPNWGIIPEDQRILKWTV